MCARVGVPGNIPQEATVDLKSLIAPPKMQLILKPNFQFYVVSLGIFYILVVFERSVIRRLIS